MGSMFWGCSSLTSLDLSSFDTSNVTDMFNVCPNLSTIKMVGCSEDIVNKVKLVKPSSATIVTQ